MKNKRSKIKNEGLALRELYLKQITNGVSTKILTLATPPLASPRLPWLRKPMIFNF